MKRYPRINDDMSMDISKTLYVEKYNVFDPENENIPLTKYTNDPETYETTEEYVIQLNLQGYAKKNVHVKIAKRNILSVQARKKVFAKNGENIFEIARNYSIPPYCDTDDVKCEFNKQGMLKIRFRKICVPNRSISLENMSDKEIAHRKECICVSLDIGDFREDEIKVKSENGSLIIKGKCLRTKKDARRDDVMVKRKFKRVYIIDHDIQSNHIRTKKEGNKLYIELPREHLITNKHTYS
ncbi:hypothetical protein RF11_15132 [Thelohanellus kitauei]|uniref:SHSP domain-containing protein n=1 Tax=Thelohanellus kitauei TaxID=669202 RepID=A0A0C2J5B5_THEKT|nr:hypothetical protein RF11_15132 [Thelohanellus kitauei]